MGIGKLRQGDVVAAVLTRKSRQFVLRPFKGLCVDCATGNFFAKDKIRHTLTKTEVPIEWLSSVHAV